ncbi:MAG: hypothetical protein ACYDBQ_03515 [Thermoplasmatota archaeon]
MPELPSGIVADEAESFASGFLRSGALKPLAIGAGVVGGGLALGYAGKELLGAFGNALNPPAQTGTIPNGMPPGPGGTGADGYFFDPKTGRTYLFGAPPVAQNGPDRSTESITKTTIIAGVIGLAAIAVLVYFKGGK